MSDLSSEEKRRIYEEEKARLETDKKGGPAPTEAKRKKKSRASGCLIIVLVFAGLYIAYMAFRFMIPKDKTYRQTSRSTYTAPRPTITGPTIEDEKMLKDLIESGIVDRVNANMNEATVDPASWAQMKFDAKKHLGWFLATYCGKKKGTNLNWVDIIDSYSGKKLAKYSEAYGFKVY